jgi:hypothetical protein
LVFLFRGARVLGAGARGGRHAPHDTHFLIEDQ